MRPIYLLFFLLSPVLGFTQETEARVELAGIWELDLKAQLQELQKHKNSQYAAMPEPAREMFLASLETRKYIFYPDGGFEAYWLLGGKSQVLRGTWELEFPDLLRLFPENGREKVYTISSQQQTLRLVAVGNTGNLLQTLYFKREGP